MVRTKAEAQKCCSTSEKLSLPDVAWAEVLAKLTWALAHPARVKILKDSGLVQGEIDGPRVCYCIKKEAMATLKKLIADL
jgi:ArsR family transcriptional regulator, arsenate/arsenite/antimonite-responsive transcriptional repressor